MIRILRLASLVLLAASWVALATLLFTDGSHQLQFTSTHAHLSALALIFVGLAYIVFQFLHARKRAERAKGVLLGTAFVLWGSEQFLPPAPIVTLLDSLVIGIFVVDISLVMVDRFRNPNRQNISN